MEVVLEAQHTHFYPGHEGWLVGEAPDLPAGGEDLPGRIVFADGAVTGATLRRGEGKWELEVSPYATAAGTDIAAKRWQVTFRRGPEGRTRFRIERNLTARKD